jgi:hypothetical protein
LSSERQILEEQMPKDVNEIVMYHRHSDMNNERYELTEGLSSNFFVIQNGSLLTAPDSVVLNKFIHSFKKQPLTLSLDGLFVW